MQTIIYKFFIEHVLLQLGSYTITKREFMRKEGSYAGTGAFGELIDFSIEGKGFFGSINFWEAG